MNFKITSLFSLFAIVLFLGCSSDDGGPSCRKVQDASFYAQITSVSVSYYSESDANSFKIEYGPTGFTPGTGTSFITSSTTVSVDNLTPSTTYDFYITSICSADESSEPYKLSSVTTNPSQCVGNASATFTQFAIDNVSLYFSYSGTSPDYYEVEYGPAGFALGTGTRVATTWGETSKTIYDLDTDTTYDFYVRAFCSQGDASAFTKLTYTTMGSCPSPLNLNTYVLTGACNQGMGATRVFSWSYLFGQPQSSTISIVEDATQGPGGNVFTTSQNAITISNMYCNWEAFFVRANCADGSTSEWTGPYYF